MGFSEIQLAEGGKLWSLGLACSRKFAHSLESVTLNGVGACGRLGVVGLGLVEFVERRLNDRVAQIHAVGLIQDLASVLLALAFSFGVHQLARSVLGVVGVHGLAVGVDLWKYRVGTSIGPSNGRSRFRKFVPRLSEVDLGVLVFVVLSLGVQNERSVRAQGIPFGMAIWDGNPQGLADRFQNLFE